MVDWKSVATVTFLVVALFQSTFEQQTERLNSSLERLALLQLRSSLGLRSKDWPIKGDPCTIWNGIQCQNGSVVGINISGFRRTRIGRENPQFSIDAIVNLTRLVSLNASGFLLPGPIPDWFGLILVNLQVLDLRSCLIRGSIPRSIGNITTLTTLILADNALTGIIPSNFGQLSSLSVLDLSQNSLIGFIPNSFGFLGNLTLLNLSDNFLSGSIPPEIGTLSKLQFLNLSANSLSSLIPSQFDDLNSLVDLDLRSNSFTGSIQDFTKLKNLQKILIGNNFLSGPLPENLFSTSVQLQEVDLSGNNFTDVLPFVLWTIPSLRSLDVSSNNFSGALPNSSFNTNATAAEFNLSGNMFYGVLPPPFRRFSYIDLSSNYFEGSPFDYLQSNASFVSNCLQNASRQRTLEECTSFYSARGLTFDNFGFPNSTQPQKETSGRSHRKLIILACVIGGFSLLLLSVLLFVLFICIRKRNGSPNHRGVGVGPTPAEASPPATGVSINLSSLGDAFTYQQLLQATSDFSEANFIKHGHSGDLFLGSLENGIPIVVKKIDLPSIKKDSYLIELDFFSKVSHARFVPLVGHCLDNENEKYLVYKYMPNGDLFNSLYRKSNSDDDSLQSLDWITRLKIALGVAEGLSYLHHECTPPLVHRDVQASSILLDDKFEVRLGSLSEVCTQEGESQQSRITRFLRLPQSSEQGATGTITGLCAYDVYCFGKVLLELVTGKLGISASSDTQMKEWLEQTLPFINIYDKELVTKIIDPSLIIDEDLLEEVWAMAIVAKSCLNPKPSRRPLMRYIQKALENPLKVVREENSGSARLRTTSSRGSWNAAVFGSWRQSSSDVAGIPGTSTLRGEGMSSRHNVLSDVDDVERQDED